MDKGLDQHRRFIQQAGWSRPLRQDLLRRAGFLEDPHREHSILEVGCGSGAICAELETLPNGRIFGLDLDLSGLRIAQHQAPGSIFVRGDALSLPYPSACFDLVMCHFFLLWVPQPLLALQEMKRVVRPGGSVLASAEPDYGGRIDYPPLLAQIGALQRSALLQQGAEPDIGRRLAALFLQSGLKLIEFGLTGGQWRPQDLQQNWEPEWTALRNDLKQQLKLQDWERLHTLEAAARERGERVLYVPTFYAWGRRAAE